MGFWNLRKNQEKGEESFGTKEVKKSTNEEGNIPMNELTEEELTEKLVAESISNVFSFAYKPKYSQGSEGDFEHGKLYYYNMVILNFLKSH